MQLQDQMHTVGAAMERLQVQLAAGGGHTATVPAASRAPLVAQSQGAGAADAVTVQLQLRSTNDMLHSLANEVSSIMNLLRAHDLQPDAVLPSQASTHAEVRPPVCRGDVDADCGGGGDRYGHDDDTATVSRLTQMASVKPALASLTARVSGVEAQISSVQARMETLAADFLRHTESSLYAAAAQRTTDAAIKTLTSRVAELDSVMTLMAGASSLTSRAHTASGVWEPATAPASSQAQARSPGTHVHNDQSASSPSQYVNRHVPWRAHADASGVPTHSGSGGSWQQATSAFPVHRGERGDTPTGSVAFAGTSRASPCAPLTANEHGTVRAHSQSRPAGSGIVSRGRGLQTHTETAVAAVRGRPPSLSPAQPTPPASSVEANSDSHGVGLAGSPFPSQQPMPAAVVSADGMVRGVSGESGDASFPSWPTVSPPE
ncbi:hypothetical protein EON66_02565 [archaeon]|nr:MAG: hypothetical protein EON66_02565 [archaeon]